MTDRKKPYTMSPRLKAILKRKRQQYIDRYGHPPTRRDIAEQCQPLEVPQCIK